MIWRFLLAFEFFLWVLLIPQCPRFANHTGAVTIQDALNLLGSELSLLMRISSKDKLIKVHATLCQAHVLGILVVSILEVEGARVAYKIRLYLPIISGEETP